MEDHALPDVSPRLKQLLAGWGALQSPITRKQLNDLGAGRRKTKAHVLRRLLQHRAYGLLSEVMDIFPEFNLWTAYEQTVDFEAPVRGRHDTAFHRYCRKHLKDQLQHHLHSQLSQLPMYDYDRIDVVLNILDHCDDLQDWVPFAVMELFRRCSNWESLLRIPFIQTYPLSPELWSLPAYHYRCDSADEGLWPSGMKHLCRALLQRKVPVPVTQHHLVDALAKLSDNKHDLAHLVQFTPA